MYIAVSLILLLVIGVLLYISRNLRLDLSHRHLHSRYVCFTIVYSIICVVGFSLLLLGVNALLSIEPIRNGLFRIVPENNTAAAFYWIVTLAVNILFLTIFDICLFLIKKIWIPRIVQSDFTDDYLDSDDSNVIEKLFHNVSNWFYDGNKLKTYADNVGVWIRTMKKLFGMILLAEAFIMTIVVGIGVTIIPEEILSLLSKSLYMIPMASYIILNQFEIFLCADQRIDEGLIDTEEIGEKVIGDYSPLIKLYESLFGGKSLISYYLKGEGDFTHSLYAGVDETQIEKCNDPELLNAIYRNLENGVERVSTKYIDGLVDLINGANIAVVDSMYGEFNIYFLSYLQHQLSLHKKALVVCDTEWQVEDMIRKYKDVFFLINRVSSVWRIGKVEDVKDGKIDILICTEEQLLEGNLKHKFNDFFENVSNVVLMDAYGLICRDKAFLTRLFNCVNLENIQYTFFIPENNPDIRTVIEEYVNDDVIVYENYNETTNTCIMYWRQEPALKPQYVMSSSLLNDLGVAYTISLIAAKFDVLDINIQAPSSVPIYSYRNTATGEYAKVLSDEFFKRESLNIDSVIKVNNMLIFKSKELAFNVLHDENNNLLSLTNMWLSYGGRTCSMLHMISRPYMLRDYFAYNLSELHGKLSDVKMFVPIKVLNIRAAALAFLIKTRTGVYIEEILEFAHLNKMNALSAEGILEELLDMVLGKNHNHRVYESFAFDEFNVPKYENEKYIYSHTVKMTSQPLYEELCNLTLHNAVIVDKSKKYVLAINKNDIFNHYLPNQCYSFNGSRYYILEINNGEIMVVREESSLVDKEYTSLYNIKSVEAVSRINKNTLVENENYKVEFFAADIMREIWGYLEHSNGIDFGEGNNTEVKKLVSPIVEKKRANYLSVEFNYNFGENYEGIASLLVVLVRGALETLLPKNYKDLLVFSNIDKKVATNVTVEGTDAEVELIEDERLLHLYPNMDESFFEKNSSSNLRLFIVDYSTVETGALYSIATDLERMLMIIKKYIEWVLAHKEINNHYLYFGLGSMPSIFEPEALCTWLNNITPKITYPDKVIDGNFTIAASRYCAFCGRPIITSGILLNDGRAMCEECAKHRANTKKEVKVLLRKAYNIIESKYGVTVPPGIKIKFATAEEVARVANTPPGYITLGVYIPSQHKVMVVRGGPETNVLATLIHELTHAWQHKNASWILTDDNLKYCEGHTMYTEIECMYALKEVAFAERLEKDTEARDDEYGEGFRYWKEYLKGQTDKNIFHHINDIKGA